MEAIRQLVAENSQVNPLKSNLCVCCTYLLQVLVWVGLFYVAKLALSAVLDLCDGLNGFILPKIWRRDLSRYNTPREILIIFFFSEYGAWALVTGCTRGIGREYALGLAR